MQRPKPSLFTIVGIGLIFVAAFYVYAVWIKPNHDNSWFLLATARLMSGGRYYTDVFEVNPPLVSIILAPCVAISKIWRIDSNTALVGEVLVLIGLSVALSRSILIWAFEPHHGRAEIATVVLAGFLTAVGYDFGERDHIAIVLAIPGILWLAAREAEYPVGGAVSVALMAMMSCGLLLKPEETMVLIALLLVRGIKLRSVRGLVDIQLMSFAAVGICYAFTVLIAFPDYISVAQIATTVYGGYRSSTVEMLRFVRMLAIEIALIWGLYETSPFGTRMQIFGRMILVAALVFLVVAFNQGKVWSYHLLPTRILAATLAGFVVIELFPDVVRSRTWFTAPSMAILLGVVICSRIMMRQLTDLPSRHELIASEFAREVASLARGRSIWVLNTEILPQFPTVPLMEAQWASRTPFQWLVPEILQLSKGDQTDRHEAEKLRELAVTLVVQDFARYRPDVVAVPSNSIHAHTGDVNLLAFMSADDRFRKVWSTYRLAVTTREWNFYLRSR
jgi:hypothetical protein